MKWMRWTKARKRHSKGRLYPVRSKSQLGPQANYECVPYCKGTLGIERIGDMPTGMRNVLNGRLQPPVWCKLYFVRQLDNRFVVADRHRAASDTDDVAIILRCPRRHAAIGNGQ